MVRNLQSVSGLSLRNMKTKLDGPYTWDLLDIHRGNVRKYIHRPSYYGGDVVSTDTGLGTLNTYTKEDRFP